MKTCLALLTHCEGTLFLSINVTTLHVATVAWTGQYHLILGFLYPGIIFYRKAIHNEIILITLLQLVIFAIRLTIDTLTKRLSAVCDLTN